MTYYKRLGSFVIKQRVPFDPTKANITFGAYFKLSLCKHFRSLLRRENAQKRLLEKQVISLEELLYEKVTFCR